MTKETPARPEDRIHKRDLPLSEIEVDTLGRLVEALAALQDANSATRDGLASDHMHNAAREIRMAIRMVGGT